MDGVVKATPADLTTVLGWLEREYDDDGEGFWCNRRLIERALDDGDLWAIRGAGDAVAFQVGHYAAPMPCIARRDGFPEADSRSLVPPWC